MWLGYVVGLWGVVFLLRVIFFLHLRNFHMLFRRNSVLHHESEITVVRGEEIGHNKDSRRLGLQLSRKSRAESFAVSPRFTG